MGIGFAKGYDTEKAGGLTEMKESKEGRKGGKGRKRRSKRGMESVGTRGII